MLYTDRAREDLAFSPAVPLPTLDYLTLDGFMTEDCAHLYFEGPSAVFASQPD